jgi:D-serine deaminase-like pyridoxal phosphate-dependent protein
MLGVRLRPHMKTAKAIDVARLVHEPGEGITVSTLAEAEYFADHGISDILYAVGFEPGKAGRARRLSGRGVDLQVIVDSADMAGWLARADLGVGVWLEIDADGTRCGLESRSVVEAAALLGPRFRGVMTHAGGSYACHGADEIAVAALAERAAVTEAAEVLRSAGIEVPGVSVGSTPTATFGPDLTGVTEMRPGVFMFQDLYQTGLGVCSVDDIAVSVLTAVIGHRRTGELVIDAGALALSLDRSTSRQALDWGFGAVCDERGDPIEGLVVRAVTQEHGIVAHRVGGLDPKEYPIGRRLRILPNHACMTAAAHDRYHVLTDTDIVATWLRHNGW